MPPDLVRPIVRRNVHGHEEKTNSSSGLFRVKGYNEQGMPRRNGTRMFPRQMMNRMLTG